MNTDSKEFVFRCWVLFTAFTTALSLAGCSSFDLTSTVSATGDRDYPFVVVLKGKSSRMTVGPETLVPFRESLDEEIFIFCRRDSGTLTTGEYFLSRTNSSQKRGSEIRSRGLVRLLSDKLVVDVEQGGEIDGKLKWFSWYLNGTYPMVR